MGWTYEEIVADLQAARIDRPKKKPATKPAALQLVERWSRNVKPTEAVIQDATTHNKALAERIERETMEDGRRQQEAKELAHWNAENENSRIRYQRRLDEWQQSVLDAQETVRALHGEIPERGVYSPIARFEREVKEGK